MVACTDTVCISGERWQHNSTSRKANQFRITVNLLHLHLPALHQIFVPFISHLHLPPRVLLIQHFLPSYPESIHHWHPARTHHMAAYQHLPVHRTSVSRAHSNGPRRKRKTANSETKVPRSLYWRDKLYSRSWAAHSGTRSADTRLLRLPRL